MTDVVIKSYCDELCRKTDASTKNHQNTADSKTLCKNDEGKGCYSEEKTSFNIF